MSERWGFGAESLRRGFASVGWAALKIPLVLLAGTPRAAAWGYGRGYDGAAQPRRCWALWLCLLASYLYWRCWSARSST